MCEDEELDELQKYFEDKGYKVFRMMAAIAEGTRELVNYIAATLATLPPIKIYEAEALPEVVVDPSKSREFSVTMQDGKYVIEAEWLLKILENVDPDDYESLQYFQRVLQTSGIIDKLNEMGVMEGDTVCVYDIEFDYVE